MSLLNGNRMRWVIIGIIAAIVISSENTKADFVFGGAVNLGPTVNTDGHNNLPCISADGLELYFGIEEKLANGYGQGDIWLSTRETTEDAWGIPKNLGPLVNSSRSDNGPAISGDGLELYFMSWRDGGMGSIDIWVTKRASKNDPWEQAVNVGTPVNSADRESFPSLSADALELYFTVGNYNGENGAIFCVSKRETRDAPWGEPVSLGPTVNSWPHQVDPSISSDGLALVFCDWWQQDPRPGGLGGADLWLSLRPSKDSEWGAPVNLGGHVNTTSFDGYGMISADGSMLYFTSSRAGGSGGADLWQAPILTIADFDGDGSVGLSDLILMVDAWSTDNPRYDIGPMPWGDGVVDAADLEVLMEYWDQEVDYPYDPKFASDPRPSDGSTMDVDEDISLSWIPGQDAVEHDVYLGTDLTSVKDADISDTSGIYRGRQDVSEYTTTEELELGQIFFWRVDGINPDGIISKGKLWSFNVADVVDNFESYIVEGGIFDPGQIYMTWVDGWGDPENGSQVGYAGPPFVELTIVHSGLQSMPFFYDNSSALISRTFREWENPQDWTLRGTQLLKLWVYGQADNSIEPFFVTLKDETGKDETVTFPDFNPTTDSWQQLSLPLSDFVDVDMKAIKRMYMGVGDKSKPGSSGKLLIDDIELHLL